MEIRHLKRSKFKVETILTPSGWKQKVTDRYRKSFGWLSKWQDKALFVLVFACGLWTVRPTMTHDPDLLQVQVEEQQAHQVPYHHKPQATNTQISNVNTLAWAKCTLLLMFCLSDRLIEAELQIEKHGESRVERLSTQRRIAAEWNAKNHAARATFPAYRTCLLASVQGEGEIELESHRLASTETQTLKSLASLLANKEHSRLKMKHCG